MRSLPYMIAAAAVSSLALTAAPSSASPLAGGLTGGATVPEMNESLVQKVHGWHCRAKKGWYRGDRYWHRHRRACRDYSYRYQPYYYGAPSFGLFFNFDDDDGRRRHKGKRRHD
jgi:hypothetical protein